MTRSSAQLQPPTGSCFHPGWNGRSQTSWSCSKLTFSVEPRSSPSTPSLDRYNLFSLIFKPFELNNNQVYAGWGGEGGIAFALLTRQPRVRIPAPPFLLTAQFLDSKKRSNPSSAYARDFANAVQQGPVLQKSVCWIWTASVKYLSIMTIQLCAGRVVRSSHPCWLKIILLS